MATDTWLDATDNWDTPSDWSAGLPGASSDVVINSRGDPKITSSFGTVNSITANAGSWGLTFIDAGANSVAGDVTLINPCYLSFDNSSGDGGSTLFTGGKLNISDGSVAIGPSDNTLSAASTIEAGSLENTTYGTIDLSGSATAEATLNVRSAAGFGTGGVLNGYVGLSGDALIEFGTGQITTIAANAHFSLLGSHAFVGDASNTGSNSALAGLKVIEDGAVFGLNNGATVTTSGALANTGEVVLDWLSGYGGSALTVNGRLTNSGTIQIGPSNGAPSAESTLDAVKVVNDGAIDLYGDGRAAHAKLRCEGPFTNDGSVNLTHDADTIGGAVGGTGDFTLSRSTLQFVHGVSSGETVTFEGVDHLYLDSPSSFNGTIDDFFTKGNSVNAKGFAEAATLLTYTQTGADSCSWTLTDPTHTAVLNFTGAAYTQSDFSISPSANGNTLIKFV